MARDGQMLQVQRAGMSLRVAPLVVGHEANLSTLGFT